MSIETGVGGPRLLAQGPVATVYAGRDPATGNDFAIKMFPGSFDRETSAWLDRERKALAAVRSTRSILQIDDVMAYPDGRSGIRRELCAGSLAGLLDSGTRLGVSDVLALGAAIASALAAAHGADVLHGGVSPHNVLYRASGEFVLADFSVALRRRFPRDPMYAVEYTAPETLRDDTLSAASDLYGLGAVLYTALTGAPPFPRHTGQQPGERILQVLREPVAPIQDPSVPRELSGTILRLLAKEPADRPQDVASLARLFTKLRQPGGEIVTGESPDLPSEEEEADVEFDDFAEVSRPAAAAPSVPQLQPVRVVQAPPAGGRTLIREFSGPLKRDREIPWRPIVTAGAGVLLAGLAVVPLVLGPAEIGGQAVPLAAAIPAPSPASAPAPDVKLALAPPQDQSDHVQLTWTAEGELDFVVIMAGERLETKQLVAHRQRGMDVPVDPARRYCFQLRATDGRHVYTTDPMPIRGARCNP
ncbi:serine/threonine protein kinase [Amycolatopsis regifaucium]|uniref:non-specific serine/threonine protein kinase n=1 Tax=Amycolatopsis regifaucium TaxID=546365 RepID=A0A154MB19_9PSEU|nr:protein kinase [Amycolatopsis regifaucium]KZB81480.1 serine/threonine protein kinase [Amycolatopsis regifaucium]OKA04743.1 serine/threonine protein kinase [Amycolatopsis regifaucium]SFH30292.1 Serine/threonine protein kinase [Amycolatopsis regifaucium]